MCIGMVPGWCYLHTPLAFLRLAALVSDRFPSAADTLGLKRAYALNGSLVTKSCKARQCTGIKGSEMRPGMSPNSKRWFPPC